MNCVSYRAAGGNTRWRSTIRQQLWTGSCGGEPTRFEFLHPDGKMQRHVHERVLVKYVNVRC